MLRSLMIVGVLVGMSCLPAQEQPKQISGGPGTPLSPVEARKLFKVAEGLTIQLVAAEPQIESPVAMAFDPSGRLWVVEMRDYPNGPAKGQAPEGRIKVLDDTDGDGSSDLDGLLVANGLFLWKDGVIVTAAPHIAWLRDTDSDGKADTTEVLYEGFAAENPQLRVSNPVLGLDGFVYVANGLRGGRVRKAGARPSPSRSKDAPGEVINLSGMDFRFHLLTGEHEAITGPGQFGNTFDDWGQRFVCDNRHHLRHIVLENSYIKRHPHLAAAALVNDPSVLADGPLGSGGKIYPLSKNWTTSSLHEGRFTAACGVFIYRGQLLPPDCRGAAFTCDPTGNLVHQEILEQRGGSFVSRPAKEGVEFLASPDDWFRPVFLTHGPDDALYVVDMYRAVIEHPEYMPPELQKRPDLTLGKDKGRIWKIVPAHAVLRSRPERDLAQWSTAALVAALNDPRPWWRTTAQRLLLERNDEAAVAPLRALLDAAPRSTTTPEGGSRGSSPQARVLAAYLLDGMIYLDEERLLRLLGDEHPRVRENAVKLCEARLSRSPVLQQRLLAMANDADPRVRLQTALTLGNWDNDRIVPALAKIAMAGGDDPWTRLAVASSLLAPANADAAEPKRVSRALPVLQAVLHDPGFRKQPVNRQEPLILDFAALAASEVTGLKVAVLAKELGDEHLQLALLTGFADGLARQGVRVDDYFQKAAPNPNDPVIQWLRDFIAQQAKTASNPKESVADRLAAVRLLSRVSWQAGGKALADVLANDVPTELRLAAIRAVAGHGHKEITDLLMKGWRGYTPAVRREVVEAMFRTPERILALLGEIEAQRVRPGDLDPLRLRQLLNHPQPNIRVLANKLLRDSLPADRQEALKKYQAALTMMGDAKRGQTIFKAHCATCHRVAGIGVDVGPDIADTRTKTPAALLTDIIIPNQAIDNNYVNYVVTTVDGRSLTGIITAETATSITLKRAEGQVDIVLRSQIEELQSTGVSLMPDGLEQKISVAEMADLLAFLKNWRYLDGSVPANR
ncbi:MAG: HEAT repeat domain-containing protein [Gemmataceae bacterium]|nr:HEAT repeat domain-containing protein [Gemmataceae bacterium]